MKLSCNSLSAKRRKNKVNKRDYTFKSTSKSSPSWLIRPQLASQQQPSMDHGYGCFSNVLGELQLLPQMGLQLPGCVEKTWPCPLLLAGLLSSFDKGNSPLRGKMLFPRDDCIAYAFCHCFQHLVVTPVVATFCRAFGHLLCRCSKYPLFEHSWQIGVSCLPHIIEIGWAW